jgi:quinol-cytochrome oxidoreductase complex cytochrome b subunit
MNLEQQVQTIVDTSAISWELYLGLSFLPFLIAIASAICITTYIKIINRAKGKEPYNRGTQIEMAIVCGVIMGVFCQWGLQELLISYLNTSPNLIKTMIVTGAFTGIFTPMSYPVIRSQASKRGWDGLYAFLSVKHKRGVDYTDPYADGDITTFITDKEDTTERKD